MLVKELQRLRTCDSLMLGVVEGLSLLHRYVVGCHIHSQVPKLNGGEHGGSPSNVCLHADEQE